MISSSLWRVNAARQALLPLDFRRPDAAHHRARISRSPPKRHQSPPHPRQPDGRHRLQLCQRQQDAAKHRFSSMRCPFWRWLVAAYWPRRARAGQSRKPTQPSRAIAILPDTAVESLKALDGQTMTRAEFNQAINALRCAARKAQADAVHQLPRHHRMLLSHLQIGRDRAA